MTHPTAQRPNSPYPHGVELATAYWCGIALRLSACAGDVTLTARDTRPGDPMSPVRLRRHQPAIHTAPALRLTGRFAEDSALAQRWLDHHKPSIASLEIVNIARNGHTPLLRG